MKPQMANKGGLVFQSAARHEGHFHLPQTCLNYLYLLEVELRVGVEPVSDLDDVEELEHEVHVDVGVSLPQHADVEEVLPDEDVPGPQDGHEIEAEQLSTLVELGVLDLGQVQLAVHLVQQVLLDDLVHHHGDQQVEERGGHILQQIQQHLM